MNKEKEWFENGNWNRGLPVRIHSSVNLQEFYVQYHKRQDLWDAAFDFLKGGDLKDKPVGKYPLKGNEAVAIVSEYLTKPPEEAKWEAHRKFIDLQYLIRGEENMGVLSLKEARNALPYQEEKDLLFYGEQDGGAYFKANPKVCFLFFPADVHRPGMRIGEPEPVKKLVIKIAVAG
ncbi:MAG: YhcH/YjgK/YiaL family protein [Mangrovibacterium sp.]